ncbi:unnamed protein product [Leptidea sinapis]|uniref:Carboxylesterase type B domain-containing protein n=1 Tax=Leptidea sinapis TaxID=189913 RepID=A0A5E4QSU7_9NEOP|nr:unnamed protein product [Leptidea sinapis]
MAEDIFCKRLKPPVPNHEWEGTHEAHHNKPTCVQYSVRNRNDEPLGISGSEDCLYLSVFTPNLDGSSPVIVFDYNDHFKTGFNGSHTYSPEFFIQEDVIVVYISHRLGVFGYLTTEDEVIPPNAGLKDFILGLKWVQENIKDFGGDPKRVTLMGNNGGAVIANLLLYSKQAKDLFTAIIIHSGSAMESTLFYSNPRSKAFRLGELLNIETTDSSELLENLQRLDKDVLVSEQDMVIDDDLMDNYQMSIHPFSPTIEKDSADAILTSLPEKLNIINDVPVMIGFNSREGLDFASHYIIEPRMINNNPNYFFVFPVRVDFRFDRNSSIYEKALEEIKYYYMKDGYLHHKNILEYTVYVGDVLKIYAAHVAAKTLARGLQSNVYYYKFDFRGLLNENSNYLSKIARFGIGHWGATVTDELCYLYLCSRIKKMYKELNELPSQQPENPTQPGEDEILKNFKWLPINKDADEMNYLHITKQLKMKLNPLDDRAEFWLTFLDKYSKLAVNGLVQENLSHDEL